MDGILPRLAVRTKRVIVNDLRNFSVHAACVFTFLLMAACSADGISTAFCSAFALIYGLIVAWMCSLMRTKYGTKAYYEHKGTLEGLSMGETDRQKFARKFCIELDQAEAISRCVRGLATFARCQDLELNQSGKIQARVARSRWHGLCKLDIEVESAGNDCWVSITGSEGALEIGQLIDVVCSLESAIQSSHCPRRPPVIKKMRRRSNWLDRYSTVAPAILLTMAAFCAVSLRADRLVEQRAWTYYNAHQYKRASEDISRFAGVHTSQLKNIQALAFLHSGKTAQAISILEPIANEDGIFKANLAYAYALDHDYKKARRTLDELRSDSCSRAASRASFVRGFLAQKRGDRDQAIDDFTMSMVSAPYYFADTNDALSKLSSRADNAALADQIKWDTSYGEKKIWQDLALKEEAWSLAHYWIPFLLFGAAGMVFGRRAIRKLNLHLTTTLLPKTTKTTEEDSFEFDENAAVCLELGLAAASESSGLHVASIDDSGGVIEMSDNRGLRTLSLAIESIGSNRSRIVIRCDSKDRAQARAIKSKLQELSGQQSAK